MKTNTYNNKVIKDALLAFLVITNFVLVLFLLLNSVVLLKEIKVEACIAEQYHNHVTAELNSNSNEAAFSPDALLETLSSYKAVHAKLKTPDEVGEVSQAYEITVAFSDSERLVLSQNSTVQEYGKGLFLGEAVAELLDESDTLYLFGDTYKVDGILKNDVAGGYDDRIIIFWNSLKEQSKEYLKKELVEHYQLGMLIGVCLDADEELDDTVSELSEKLTALGVDMDIMDSSRTANYLSWLYQNFSKIGLGLVGIFAIVNCGVISNVWIAQNKKLLAVLLALGYKNRDIYRFVLKELFHYVVIALPITCVLQGIYMIAVRQRNVLNIVYELPVFLVGILMVLIIFAWIPLLFIFKKTPLEVMRMR